MLGNNSLSLLGLEKWHEERSDPDQSNLVDTVIFAIWIQV